MIKRGGKNMPLDLVRIDDRLVHGQVVVGWGAFLKTTKIILCNDTIANSEQDSELYMNAEVIAPYPLTISVWTQEQTLHKLHENNLENERIILLVENPHELLQLIQSGLKIDKVNVGGMHYKAGKHKLVPYIYVDDDDISSFKKLHEMGIKLEGKDVPTGKSINISKVANL